MGLKVLSGWQFWIEMSYVLAFHSCCAPLWTSSLFSVQIYNWKENNLGSWDNLLDNQSLLCNALQNNLLELIEVMFIRFIVHDIKHFYSTSSYFLAFQSIFSLEWKNFLYESTFLKKCFILWYNVLTVQRIKKITEPYFNQSTT